LDQQSTATILTQASCDRVFSEHRNYMSNFGKSQTRMSELTSYSGSVLVKLIANHSASPVEVMEAHLAVIDQLNPKLNAIVTIAPDVIERAREAEAAVMRGDVLGALHGLPVTIKDTIEAAGLRTTSGSLMRADFVPANDAPAVRRLKEAGALVLGKTNCAEMAMEYTAENPVFGSTNHPLDASLTPGGSSGGEAAAIASCMSPCGLGTDLAGSIRIPAHFCGIVGLKPTVGQVPGEGQFPPNTGPYSLGAAIGPMARRVEDLQLLFNVLSGDARPQLEVNHLAGRRVAWYSDDDVSPVTNETRLAVETAARALQDAGLVVGEQRPPGIERGHDLWLKLFSRASVVQLRNLYQDHEDQGGDFVRWRLAKAHDEKPPTMDEYIGWWMERDKLRDELLAWMKDTPLLIAPVGATPAFAHGTHKLTVGEQTFSTFRAFSYCQAFNVFDLPVVTVAAGRSAEGLPIGVQIVGLPFAEQTVLTAAAIVEQALSDNL
jgi:Asp-tRNA(Asn)/Glu-tRNA(Gln) amidotransferase A subunit family amidase